MKISLYTLTSPLHDENAVNSASADFISNIEDRLGYSMDLKGQDFSDYGNDGLDLIYVRTGGTEGLFKELLPGLHGDILLLTSGKSNSLAASMEILSYLNQQGRKGEIIHGSTEYIADRLKMLSKVSSARRALNGQRLGIIGKPSDWLISSEPDKDSLKETYGIELVAISIDELIRIFRSDEDLAAYSNSFSADLSQQMPQSLQKYTEGALRIYHALKRLVEKYSLTGLTIRCFDLLTTVENTGCLALAMLNAEGIPAGCEGDVPTLVTMAIGKALTGQCGFQCNPSRINPETGEILMAHCTVPFDMIRSYSFNTHFESGIGIAIHGELPEGPVTILKFSGDMKRRFICRADLKANPYENSLCRTQVVMQLEGDISGICKDYFLKSPIGNHHVVFTGDHADLFGLF